MTTEPFLALACGSLIAFLFGLAVCFAGYRLFFLLLPIWGFFFGLIFGAQAMQAILGTGFLGDVTSWVVGFVVGAVFAVLSYLFYFIAVAIIAFSLGYTATTGVFMAIGFFTGPIGWLIAVAVGVVLAFVAIRYNLQKWVIIAATAILGAGTIFGSFILLFNPSADVVANPVQVALKQSPLLMILFLALVVFGFIVQYRLTRATTITAYNRWDTAEPV